MPLSTIEEAIEDIRDGKMVILVDDEDRENEGDLTLAAEFVTPEAINFMARHGRGLICLSITEEKAQAAAASRRWCTTTPRRSAPPSPSRSRRAAA